MKKQRRWEYLVRPSAEMSDTRLRDMLRECGEIGWELVQITDTRCVFKRPLVETNEEW